MKWEHGGRVRSPWPAQMPIDYMMNQRRSSYRNLCWMYAAINPLLIFCYLFKLKRTNTFKVLLIWLLFQNGPFIAANIASRSPGIKVCNKRFCSCVAIKNIHIHWCDVIERYVECSCEIRWLFSTRKCNADCWGKAPINEWVNFAESHGISVEMRIKMNILQPGWTNYFAYM